LVGILSRLSNRRVLTWSTRSGSPAHALHAWLLSRTSDCKWTHDITRHSLDLTVAGEPVARQGCLEGLVLATSYVFVASGC
jgi:hypothetical protein